MQEDAAGRNLTIHQQEQVGGWKRYQAPQISIDSHKHCPGLVQSVELAPFSFAPPEIVGEELVFSLTDSDFQWLSTLAASFQPRNHLRRLHMKINHPIMESEDEWRAVFDLDLIHKLLVSLVHLHTIEFGLRDLPRLHLRTKTRFGIDSGLANDVDWIMRDVCKVAAVDMEEFREATVGPLWQRMTLRRLRLTASRPTSRATALHDGDR